VKGQLVSAGLKGTLPRGEGNKMHPEDLMKPDLFSEIVLMSSSTLIFASLLLIAVTALTRP